MHYPKEWFILIDGNQEGPFSILDLRADTRVTPDTLVWKPGFEKWLPIRKVKELAAVFQDVPEEKVEKPTKPTPPNDDTLTLSSEPPYLFWVVVVLIAILYACYQLFTFSH